MHPGKQDYAISIISELYKYVMFAKVDWKQLSLIEVERERLFPIDPITGHVDENRDIAGEKNPELKAKKGAAIQFLEGNLQFQKQFPITNYRTRKIGWEPRKRGIILQNLRRLKRIILK